MLWMDVRIALRRLLRPDQRAFFIGALATITVAVTALTLILQLANAVLWAPLPFADADAVVELSERNLSRQLPSYSVSTPNFQSWRTDLAEHADLAATQFAHSTLASDGDRVATRVIGFHSTHNLWRVLGINLLAGRSFTAEHQLFGAEPAAIISEQLWARRYGRDPSLIGASIGIDEAQYTVVGIAPNDVGFTDQVDVWLPLRETNDNRGDRRLKVWARLRPGVSLASLLLAGIGIAATIVYAIRQRHRELAVRMAVGASVRRLQTELVGGGARLSLLGLAIGAMAALVTIKLLGTRIALAGEPGPWLFPALAAALAVAVLASAMAAHGLARIAPTAALRGD